MRFIELKDLPAEAAPTGRLRVMFNSLDVSVSKSRLHYIFEVTIDFPSLPLCRW